MTRQNRWLAVTGVVLMLMATTGISARQDAAARPAPPPPRLPAKVDVVISRTQGDKKTSSLPFTLLVTTNGSYTNLRVGVDVPIGTTTTTRLPEGGREGVTTTVPSYKNVGTNIDCRVETQPDGRFYVTVSLSDSSMYLVDSETRSIPKVGEPAAFRTFTTSNTLAMKDGQAALFATATDKISGEVLKIDVTFNLMK